MTIRQFEDYLKGLNHRLRIRVKDKDYATVLCMMEGDSYERVMVGDAGYLIRSDKMIATIPSRWIPESRKEAKAKGYGVQRRGGWVPHRGWRDVLDRLKGFKLI